MHDFAKIGREKKARDIAQLLAADRIDRRAAAVLTDPQRLRYAQCAGYPRKTPPSPECWAIACQLLEAR